MSFKLQLNSQKYCCKPGFAKVTRQKKYRRRFTNDYVKALEQFILKDLLLNYIVF